MARLVTVMPTWAPESWVDSERSAVCTPLRAGVTVGGRPLDLGAVDRDERELGGHEDAAGDDQDQRGGEQEPGGHGCSPPP